MADTIAFSLTNITTTCFSELSVCTFFTPLALLATMAAAIFPLFALLGPCMRSTSRVFGAGYALCVLQGFLMVRLSQGRDSSDAADNDIALFFLGLCVLVSSSFIMLIDFFRSVAQRMHAGLIVKVLAASLVCASTIVLVVLPMKDVYDWLGTLNIVCLCGLSLFHIGVGAVGFCCKDKRALPIVYTVILTSCFALWAGMLFFYDRRDHEFDLLPLLATFCGGLAVQAGLVALNVCTKDDGKRERLLSDSFAKNVAKTPASCESKNSEDYSP